MNIIEITDKKAKSNSLTQEEIEYFIQGYTNNLIPDYQAAALVMAIKINGMNEEELYYLTKAMVESGEKLELGDIADNIYDKHSTGGVGDKVTIAIIPIMASMGLKVAKMSGRGLGYTGGTADKFLAIPNFNMNIPISEFKQAIKDIGCAIITTSENIAKADKKIYELRDSIACTESIPLIASSIMSKKIAAGANNILLDITYGSGAFMKNISDAEKLKNAMEKIGAKYGLNVKSSITSMEQPLGYSVGNSLEIMEAIEFLNGKENDELYDVICKLLSNLNITKEEILEEIRSKRAITKFYELVKNQEGDIQKFYEEYEKQNGKEKAYIVYSKKSGKIANVDALKIARASYILGSGREKKEDEIDYFSGVKLLKKENENVEKNEPIAEIYVGDFFRKKLAEDKIQEKILESEKEVLEAYDIY